MWFALLAALSLSAAPHVFIYKWRDAKGNLHVTDRFDQVPKELREKFQKMRDEAAAGRKASTGQASVTTTPAPTSSPPPPSTKSAPDTGPSAYEKLKQRMALEKEIKRQAGEAREIIERSRATQAELEEERGNLASNPVLNAAQPARVERMKEIDAQIAALDKDVGEQLGRLASLVDGAKAGGYPEEWVTGY